MSINLDNINAEDIKEMTGRVVFDKSPNSSNKRECRFLMSGNETILARIDRFDKYSEDLLSVDYLYDFKYTFDQEAKIATIIDFKENTENIRANEEQCEHCDKDTEKKWVNDGKKFADLYEECKETFRGTIIHLAAQGKVNYITEKIDRSVVFTLKDGSRTPFRCVISEKYLLTNNIGLVSKDNKIRVKGFWCGTTLFANEILQIVEEDEPVQTETKFNETVTNSNEQPASQEDTDFEKKITKFSKTKRSELRHIRRNGTIHRQTTPYEVPAFSGSSELKDKYELLKEYYPEEVQRAIEATYNDKTLKESQREIILDILINTNWDERHQINKDFNDINVNLNKEFYSMDAVKRILVKIILVSLLKETNKGVNILLVGPPGVGKTSIVKTLCRLLNLPYTKVPMNGIGTSCEVGGTPRLYDNCIPSRIVREFKRVGNYSLILFDEFDKMSKDHELGNPMSPFHEILDRESLFHDAMIEHGINLSNTLFVFTTNSIDDIPDTILDRMEIVYVDDYTEMEKKIIAKKYLIPSICNEYTLASEEIEWEENIEDAIANKYTISNGVREIKKNIVRIIKSIVVKRETGVKAPYYVDSKNIEELLDFVKYERGKRAKDLAALKCKYISYKCEYSVDNQKLVSKLFSDYEKSDTYERHVILNKLDSIINVLPGCDEKIDVENVKQQLNKTHYGIEEFKDAMILEAVARNTSNKSERKIYLINGMCGIGKSSAGESLACALNMPFVKISVNGVSEAEQIKGRKDLHIGKIVEGFLNVGTTRAVVLIDEIDKMNVTARDPYKALVDVFDNSNRFADNFNGAYYDTSDTLFICTSNDLSQIPTALLDRFEIIELGGYSKSEKIDIANNYIIPKKVKSYGVEDSIFFDENAVTMLIGDYCNSYGMRDVERAVDKVIRKKLLDMDERKVTGDVTLEDIKLFMGSKPYKRGNLPRKKQIGQANALAVAGNLGMVFSIQARKDPYSDEDVITGMPQESTLNSIRTAKYLVSQYLDRKLEPVRLHFSEEGVKKDGPSAGLAIYMALLSCYTEKQLDPKIAFTGEIDLYSEVFPVGGIELKLKAAQDMGIDTVYVAKENYEDLRDSGRLKKYSIEIKPVENVSQIIEEVFEKI